MWKSCTLYCIIISGSSWCPRKKLTKNMWSTYPTYSIQYQTTFILKILLNLIQSQLWAFRHTIINRYLSQRIKSKRLCKELGRFLLSIIRMNQDGSNPIYIDIFLNLNLKYDSSWWYFKNNYNWTKSNPMTSYSTRTNSAHENYYAFCTLCSTSGYYLKT